ncbi:MAG: DUF4038 domain-containing protein [bacterium]|nr:DUF4038 domain-containing protein [bacterium]
MEEMEEMEEMGGNGHIQVPDVTQWGRIEIAFDSSKLYDNPIQEVALQVMLTSPSGGLYHVLGFWDGARTWRVRFSPDEEGEWTYGTFCSDAENEGLHDREGGFLCGPLRGGNRFDEHGPIQVSADKRHFIHTDETPFFWLADTTWNGALLSTDDEWQFYLSERKRQQFTVTQWVATQWRSAPHGDIQGQVAFTGLEKIAIQPAFFRRMDARVEAVYQAELLSAPVMLWANSGGEHPEVNPGMSLPEDQAILLCEYMVARWGCYPVVWILGGDGDYREEKAERWKTIGRAVFGKGVHAPVAMHAQGRHWLVEEFRSEGWTDVVGYQSGHGDGEETFDWIVNGPASKDWNTEPRQFYLNMEPAYENHVAYQSKKPHSDHSVRKAIYWSLLNAPTAGVTYGGHGVWGWDDGSGPPVDHPRTGTPLPWQDALVMPGAEQMVHLWDLFASIDWWRLVPDPNLLVEQPGEQAVGAHILAARSEAGDLAVVYTPEGEAVHLKGLQNGMRGVWFDPRTGDPVSVVIVEGKESCRFESPGKGDWVLVLA